MALRDLSSGADYVALAERLEGEQRAGSEACVGSRRSGTPPLGEATYSVLIRSAVEAGDVAAGDRLLARMKARSPERPRRRAYAPLLAAHSLGGAASRGAVDAVWGDMAREGVDLVEADYAHVLRSRLKGPTAGVDEVFEALSRDGGCFAVSSRTARAIARDANDDREGHGWRATYERVDDKSGVTSTFGTLRRLVCDDRDRLQLRDAVFRAAGRRGAAQRDALEAFSEALDARCREEDDGPRGGPRVRVALDGANVAWYGRNFRGGSFDHAQLADAMAELERVFVDSRDARAGL